MIFSAEAHTHTCTNTHIWAQMHQHIHLHIRTCSCAHTCCSWPVLNFYHKNNLINRFFNFIIFLLYLHPRFSFHLPPLSRAHTGSQKNTVSWVFLVALSASCVSSEDLPWLQKLILCIPITVLTIINRQEIFPITWDLDLCSVSAVHCHLTQKAVVQHLQ